MTALHTLGKLHLECFSNSLERVPTYAEHFLAAFPSLCSPTHPKPSQMGLWRPGHLIQHSITLLLGLIALTQPGGVLGHCPVEKQMIVRLSSNQMGWCIAAECCGVPWILDKSLTVSPAKHPHTSSMLHGGNHTCGVHPFIYSASHKDTAVGTKYLKFELIRPKDKFPPV